MEEKQIYSPTRPVVDFHWQRELNDDDLELLWLSSSACLERDEAGIFRDEFGQSLMDFISDYRQASRYAPECFFITVDLRPHAKMNAFLETLTELEVGTQEKYARTLKELLEFAIDCGFPADDCDGSESVGDVFQLDFDHYRKFKNDNHVISASSWNIKNSHCIRFFNFCHLNFETPMPFTVSQRATKFGVTFSNGFSRREKREPAGQPLSPEFVDLLLESVVDVEFKNGRPVGNIPEFHMRDKAVIALALATGARRGTIRWTTHYEIPALSFIHGTNHLNPFSDERFEVPWATAKYDGGCAADVFTRHLLVVREWMLARQSDVMHRPYSPDNPIELDDLHTNAEVWEGTDLNGQKVGGYWRDTDQETRKRLVDVDGQSPLLFTNKDGNPISERSLSQVVCTAANSARKKNKEFPKVRLHDLRHVYGTYLALFFQSIGEPDPITLVSYSMGHLDEQTTRTYTQSLVAHRRSGRDINDYLWGCGR